MSEVEITAPSPTQEDSTELSQQRFADDWKIGGGQQQRFADDWKIEGGATVLLSILNCRCILAI